MHARANVSRRRIYQHSGRDLARLQADCVHHWSEQRTRRSWESRLACRLLRHCRRSERCQRSACRETKRHNLKISNIRIVNTLMELQFLKGDNVVCMCLTKNKSAVGRDAAAQSPKKYAIAWLGHTDAQNCLLLWQGCVGSTSLAGRKVHWTKLPWLCTAFTTWYQMQSSDIFNLFD